MIRRKISLRLILSDKCTHKCFFCSRDFNFCDSLDMNLDFARRCIAQYSRCNGELVSFSGGEPTLYPHLHELLNLSKLHNLNTRITTNGTVISEIENQTLKLVDIFHISLMSCDEQIYQKICRPNEPFRLGDILNGINKLKFLKKNIRINTIFLPEYPLEAEKIVEFCQELDIPVNIMNNMFLSNNEYDQYKIVLKSIKEKYNVEIETRSTNPGLSICSDCNLVRNCASTKAIWCFPDSVITHCPQRKNKILDSCSDNSIESSISKAFEFISNNSL